MSQAQPLSSLAPEFSNQLQPAKQVVVPANTVAVQKVDQSSPCHKDECVKNVELKPDPCVKPDPCKKPDPCVKVDPCKKPCDPCKTGMESGWGWLGALILWFIIFTVLFWLIYYSLKPAFVLQTNSNQVDTAKVLLAAVISALILVIIIWLIKAAVSRKR